MCKDRAEIEKELLVFRNEIIENRDSYKRIHDINVRLTSYYILNQLTPEDMHVFEDPVITEILEQVSEKWFSSMLNKGAQENSDA